jgi:hypothetical protein
MLIWPLYACTQAYVVLLECASCNSNAGVRLGFPLKSLPSGPFSGSDLAVTLKLNEAGGWLEDSKNTLQVRTHAPPHELLPLVKRGRVQSCLHQHEPEA